MLVAYVALARGRPVPRDAAAGALWPDGDPVSARTNLRKALQRVRQASAEGAMVEAHGDDLGLDANVETDLDRADRFHRTHLLASRQPEGIAALAEEWDIRRREMLEGWDDEWIEPHRTRATLLANDLADALASTHEAMGDLSAALVVWRDILERVPHHAQALQHALRLEHALHGVDRASDLARSARLHFREELGVAMPQELRRAMRDFTLGALEPVPPPESLRKRSELYLLGRLFESNLQSNRGEALALLARECTGARAHAHPRATLSLLTLALESTEGDSPERLQIAETVAGVASQSSEFETAHRWIDFLIAAAPSGHPKRARYYGMKGFLHGEQREWDQAREAFERARAATTEASDPDATLLVENQIASIEWHQGCRIEEAERVYRRTLERVAGREDPAGVYLLTVTHGNQCLATAMAGRFDEAVVHGRAALGYTEGRAALEWVLRAPLGYAAFMRGEREEGARQIERAVAGTLREGMARFHQMALDFALAALAHGRRERSARLLMGAVAHHRLALRHVWSPAEEAFLRGVPGLAPDTEANPLVGQSAATLAEWACEELSRLRAPVARA